MPLWKNYHVANTITDALQVLADSPGPARLIAGGTDLLLDMQQGRYPAVDTLVDVTAIPDLNIIEIRQGKLYLGGAVPLNQIVRSELVQQHARALVEACALIGGPQVRNTATLGGNVAHALPAADGTIALLALDAQVAVAGAEGLRFEPLEDLFLGPGRSILDPRRELLAGFYLPLLGSGEASAFTRIMRPQGVALPILNLALWLRREAERIAAIRIAIGPAGPKPLRACQTEASMQGQVFSAAILERALDELLSESRFRTSPYRASQEYRRQVAGVLLEDAAQLAWERAVDSERWTALQPNVG